MRIIAPFVIALVFTVVLPGRVRAELTWTKKTVELTADANASVVEAKFHFINSGKTAVDIRQIESSCGCTTAELEQRHYEPGASGDIVARFTVGSHVGLQTKTIAVTSSDRERPTMLTLAVQIPEILRITPAFVAWKHGEEAKTKQITLELLQDTPITSIAAQSSSPAMNVVLQTLVKGHKYRLDLTPAQTDQTLFAAITVHCQYGEEDKSFRAYATVKPAQAP
jgi:hypothetical protein